jgi:pimeloyl-ACP methyl ester carboxylesterase
MDVKKDKMHVTEWGVGNTKTAVLIHGIASSSLTWTKVAEELAKQDYHVYAPDLYGHGQSDKTDTYTFREWAKGVASVVPHNPDIAIGHSLGGLILASIKEQLEPKQIVFVDPAFYVPKQPITSIVRKSLRTAVLRDAKNMKKNYPLWSEDTINSELDSLKLWDSSSVSGIPETRFIVAKYLRNPGNAKMLLPHRSLLIPPFFLHKLKKASIPFKRIIGSGHNIHRDKFDEFMEEIKTVMV